MAFNIRQVIPVPKLGCLWDEYIAWVISQRD